MANGRNQVKGDSKMVVKKLAKKLIDELQGQSCLSAFLVPSKYALPGKVADEIATASASNKNEVLSGSQLHKLLGRLNESRDAWANENKDNILGPIYVELVYARGRKTIPEGWYDLMKVFLDKVNDKQDLESVISFVEAVVAYSKLRGLRGEAK